MKATTTTTSELTVLYRTFIKHNSYVVYTYLASNGVDRYTTTLDNKGIATGCICEGNAKWHKVCKHMKDAQEREATRTPAQTQEVTPVVAQAEKIAATYSTAQERAVAPLNSNKSFNIMR